MYGPAISASGNGVIPVDTVVFLPLINQYVFMATDGSYLKMTSQDNSQNRNAPAGTTFDPTKWNTYADSGSNNYNVRIKTS